jgi:hypothetical protein
VEAGGRGRRVSRRPFAGAIAAAPRSILSARAPLYLLDPSAAGVACSTRASVPAVEKGGGAGDDGPAGGGRRTGAAEGTGRPPSGFANNRDLPGS